MIDALGAGPVALDTAIFIYFIEEHPTYLPLVEPLFQAVDAGERRATTSALTLLETLMVPYREGNRALAERYQAQLTRGRNLELVPLDVHLLRTAAKLRALAAVRTPDALQLAAAMRAGCTDFVTNDRRLPEIPDLTILQLSAFLR